MGGGWASEACTIGSSTRRQLFSTIDSSHSGWDRPPPAGVTCSRIEIRTTPRGACLRIGRTGKAAAESRYVSDQSLLRCRRDELLGISQTFRPRRSVGKKAQLLGQADLPSRIMDGPYMGIKAGLRNGTP